VATHQLQVECRTGTVRQSETNDNYASQNVQQRSLHGTQPVCESQRMREVMMLPHDTNIDSSSRCVIDLGSPLTYRLAPLMSSQLGRASDTSTVTYTCCSSIAVNTRNKRVLILLAQCWFPGLAISNAKIQIIYFSKKMHRSNFIKQHSEIAMV